MAVGGPGAAIRLMLAVALVVAAIAAVRLWSPSVAELHGAEFHVFGSVAHIQVRSNDARKAVEAFAEIGTLLDHNHNAWHAWRPDSALGRINARLAAGEPADAPADLAGMIRRAQEGYRLSGGVFNAAMGRLIGAWGFHASAYPLKSAAPSDDEVADLVGQSPSMEDISIDADNRVTSRNPNVALDLNGLAEGYAAQQVAELLADRGMDDALISIGGDVLARGEAGRRPWTVGVRAPEGGVLGQVALHDGEALSSSGDYLRYRQTDHGRDGHILDPRHGRPQRKTAAVSVLSDDPVLADMAATALTVAGPEGFEQTARRMGIGCALLVPRDGGLYITPAMRSRLTLLQTPPAIHSVASTGHDCRRPNQG